MKDCHRSGFIWDKEPTIESAIFSYPCSLFWINIQRRDSVWCGCFYNYIHTRFSPGQFRNCTVAAVGLLALENGGALSHLAMEKAMVKREIISICGPILEGVVVVVLQCC